MEFSNNVSGASEIVSVKVTPILVKIFSWLLLIGGIISVPFAVLAGMWLFVGGIGEGNLIVASMGLLVLSSPVAGIIAFFGLIKMRKWAFQMVLFFTILNMLATIYQFSTSPVKNYINMTSLVIPALIVVYFWSIRRQFI